MSRPETDPPGASPRLRLAAFDLDGTLIGPDLILPGVLLEAVKRLREWDVIPAVITGRMHPTAERFALAMGLEDLPVVSFNGAMAGRAGGGEVWWYEPIDHASALDVLTFLEEHGLEPLVFDVDAIFAGATSRRLEVYSGVSGTEPRSVGNLTEWLRGPEAFARRGEPLRPSKLLQVEEVARMPALLAAAGERFGRELNVTTSYPFFLEFMSRRADKGLALARLAERLGVARSRTAAFGDGMNDLEMIKWAGLGVAMGHGPPELVAAADRVVDGPPGVGVAGFLHALMDEWESDTPG